MRSSRPITTESPRAGSERSCWITHDLGVGLLVLVSGGLTNWFGALSVRSTT